MSDEQRPAPDWARVERVLDQVLDCDRSDWDATLAEMCSGDPELRRTVEDLLSRATIAVGFLESPPVLSAALLIAEKRSGNTDDAGRRIGAYRIVRQIGRGGMSRVFLAERADGQFAQVVALKLLRPGLDAEIDGDRFRAERQILASLEHPHIARLLDGGVTADGAPYLVLEYVAGQPIDAYCQERQLSVRARLELFLTIIDATQYAHRNLVVHRDLKPSNILVTAEGSAKLLDFGLAKLLEPMRVNVEAPTTRTGQHWMTPEYAAPEQVRSDPVSTVTDVYQLGAVLYELLAGDPPFGKRSTNVHALEHAVLSQEPALPSSKIGSPEGRRALRGDLDAIVLKALRKEPERRYASAQELGDDIQRHLTGHPVQARRQTATYRTLRFVRRHGIGIAAAATIVLLAGAYGVTVTVQHARIKRALAQATVGAQKAEQVSDFVLGLFEASEQGRAFSDTVSAHELLRRGTLRARELTGQPEVRAEMLDVIGRLHFQLGDFDEARSLFEEVLGTRRKLLGEDDPEVATSLARLEPLAHMRGDHAAAIELTRRALDIRRRRLGPEQPLTIESMFWYGNALHEAGDEKLASQVFDEWAAAFRKLPPSLTERRANEHMHLGQMLEFRAELEPARQQYSEAYRILQALYGEHHPAVASAQVQLADVYLAQDRLDESERLMRTAIATLRAAYPTGHPDLSLTIGSLARLLERKGQWDEAETLFREIEAVDRRNFGEDHTTVGIRKEDLGVLLMRRGKFAEAEQYLRDAVRIYRSRMGDRNLMTMRARVNLGAALQGRGALADAESMLVTGYEGLRDMRTRMADPSRRRALESLVRLYEAEGRATEAAKYHSLLDRK